MSRHVSYVIYLNINKAGKECIVINDATIYAIRSGKAIIIGRKVYLICSMCGKYVQTNKMILGSLYICADQTKGVSK